MTTRPVVVSVDGSEESLRATEWAALEARRHRAPLRIVSAPALPPRMRPHNAVPPTVADMLYDESVRALREAVTRAEEVCSRPHIDAGLLDGPPALAVTDSGAGALMLVVGARGAGGFAQLLLGSVSRYAAMRAACPVIVVREETSAVHREVVVGVRDPRDPTAALDAAMRAACPVIVVREETSAVHREVGVRDPRDPTAALDFAFEEAALRGATLVAVHSRNLPPAVMWRQADVARLAAEADQLLAEMLEPWRGKYPGVPVRRDVVMHEHPARVLSAYAGRADLVVLGRHSHGQAIGGIQHAVLSHAHGPIAIVPDTMAVPDPMADPDAMTVSAAG